MNKLKIPDDIRQASKESAQSFDKLSRIPQVEQLNVGQVWSTHSRLHLSSKHHFVTEDPRLIVILDGEGSRSATLEQVVAAPVSLSISMAAEYDLIVSGDAGPLGFDFLVETWNETPTVKGHLKQFLGKLSDEAIDSLVELYHTHIFGEDPAPALQQWIGPRIFGGNDPRLAFQESEIEAVSYLAQAATAALGLDTEVEKEVHIIDILSGAIRQAFDLPLSFGKLSDVLSASLVAQAASFGEELDTYFIDYSSHDEKVVFELLTNPSSPYDVYVVAREVSSPLVGHECAVKTRTMEAEFSSPPVVLHEGAKIRLGEDPSFQPDQVTTVTIEIA